MRYSKQREQILEILRSTKCHNNAENLLGDSLSQSQRTCRQRNNRQRGDRAESHTI